MPGGPQPLRARWEPVPGPAAAPPPAGRKPREHRRRSAIGWFVHHYGWRAYALPVLVALTVVTVIGLVASPGTGTAAPDPAIGATGSGTVTIENQVPTTVTVHEPGPPATAQNPSGTGSTDIPMSPGESAPDPNGTFAGMSAGALPPGAEFAKTGAGTFHMVRGTSQPFGTGAERKTFSIEVEDGIQSASQDTLFADAVMAILTDDRSWVGGGQFTLQRVDSGEPDFRISLTSQMTVRGPQNCGWQIQLEASCYNRLVKRVFVNDARWVRGAVSYNGDLGSYRVYAINHEVGHALGHHHQACAENGGLAPVMMQQSWSTSNDDLAGLDPDGSVRADGKVCKPNPFPFPRGPVGTSPAP